MKHCTKCQRLYPDPVQVCPADNSGLRSVRELEPGMIVRGKYIILSWIGAGGMAAVYRARHRMLNEMRAIKVVFSRFASDEEFLKRFRHEAAIARRLRHENAVWVEDLDEIEDGRPFIAMEFLEGGDLRSLIKASGPLPVDRSLRLGMQVASALCAAHRLGIIHRDIKPDNIFITRTSEGKELAKVLDFGIAKLKEAGTTGAYTATKTGVIIGTPDYMSPEQVEGKVGDKLDGRSDLYSLGIVLYEMLTGQLPFTSETPLGMCMQHLQTTPVAPHELRPDLGIPPAVSAVLMKAMEKKRDRRFQSAEEMLAALKNPAEFAKPATVEASDSYMATRVVVPELPPQTQMVSPPAPPTMEKERGAAAAVARAAVPAAAPAPLKTSPVPAFRPPAPAVQEKPAPPPPSAVAVPVKSPLLTKTAAIWKELNPRRAAMVVAAVVFFSFGGYLLLSSISGRSSSQNPVPTGSVPAVDPDAQIRDGIIKKFQSAAESALHDAGLTVSVSSGVVTLAGNLPKQTDKDTAGSYASSVSGVKSVLNNIVVPPPAVATQPADSDTGAAARPVSDTTQTASSRPARPNSNSFRQPKKGLLQRIFDSRVSTKTDNPPKPSPPANNSNDRVSALVRVGNKNMDDGDYPAAIHNFQSALQLDSSSTAARDGLARAQRAQKAEGSILHH